MTSDPPVPRILVVDDEPDLRTLYEITLLRAGYQVQTACDLESARHLLNAREFDLLITDMRLPDGQGLSLVEELHAQRRHERSIVITAYGSAESAVRALKAGAFDYLTKPVNLDQFRRVVTAAVQAGLPVQDGDAALAQECGGTEIPSVKPLIVQEGAASISTLPPALEKMVGCSPSMVQLKHTLLKVAPSMAPVLVLGESGSGKELVARALHACSHRADGPFVAVNCGAIPETLLEAEFFGAKKGSYTGSVADREGFFQAAHGGTLFLDEIGDLPLAMQAKLLRVIQERQVRPIGSAQEIPVDVRIVSATHKNLSDMVQAGTFRQDLFYRLNVIDVRVPPLRERREDIPMLAQALLEKLAATAGQQALPVLEQGFLERLQELPLLGNVRELENTLHRCWALSDGRSLAGALLQGVPVASLAPGEVPPAAAPAQAAAMPPVPAGNGGAAFPGEEIRPLMAEEIGFPCSLESFVDAHEKALLLRALRSTHFNRTAAAALLGLNLRQIRYRMDRLKIVDERRDAGEGDPAP